MEKIFALVDCNNFYPSCERLFDLTLRGRPVIVLSNNDGLVIARSNEAKALGFKMGDAAFMMQDLIKANNVVVLSSNYALYYDICDRVREVLGHFTPRLEKYSIDECFLDLTGMNPEELEDYGHRIKEKVERWTGIPVSVGIGATKCLAKLANKVAKKIKSLRGVLNIYSKPRHLERALEITDVGDLWGVGEAYEGMLKSNGINTAKEFRDAPDHWVRSRMTVVGARIQSELKGVSCIGLEEIPPPQQEVGTAQGFGLPIESLEELKEAAANYASKEADKLRKLKQCVKELVVWVQTNSFSRDPQYGKKAEIVFPVATNGPSIIIKKVVNAVEMLYKPGYKYKRIGLRAVKLEAEDCVQNHLFINPDDTKRRNLLRVVDQLNEVSGAGTVRIASVVLDARWLTRFSRQSPHSTTRAKDLPIARVG